MKQKLKKILPNIDLPFSFLFVVLINALYVWSLGDKAGPFSWDFPGHGYQAISSLTNLKESIFNFEYFLGFYPILYPPLFHFFRDVISTVTPLDPYQSMIALLIVFQSAFFYILHKIFEVYKASAFYYVLISIIFITTSIGFVHISSWEAGTAAAVMGFAFFTFFIYVFKTHSNRYTYLLLGLIFGLTVLTHAVSASAVLVILGVSSLVYLLKRNWDLFIRNTLSIFIGFAIGSVWLVPYLTINNLIPRGGMSGYRETVYVFLAGLFAYLVFEKLDFRNKARDYSLAVSGLVLFLIGMFPLKLNSTGLHFNRYIYFGLIIIIPLMFTQTRLKSIRKWPAILAVALVILLFGARELERSKLYPKIGNVNQYVLSGRVLDATSGHLYFPHYMNTNLVLSGNNLVATGGTFVENAPNAILALSLRMSVNPDAWFPLFTNVYKNIITYSTRGNIEEKIKLFGISHIIVTNRGEIDETKLTQTEGEEGDLEKEGDDPEEQDKYHRLMEVTFGRSPKYKSLVNYIVELKDTKPLIEPLSYVPEFAEQRDLFDSWAELSVNNLYTEDPFVKEYVSNELDFEATIEEVEIETDEIRFKVISEAPAPILVKFAYSPYLKAYENGNEIKVMKISPDFILIFGKGDVKITTYVPRSFVAAKYTTFFSLFLISGYLVVSVFAERKK